MPVTSATSAISTFVWLLALSYLYTEMTTDERAMGVFILPLLVALQTIPALRPGDRGSRRRPSGTAVRSARVVAAVRVRELCAGLRDRHYVRAALQGDQGEASGVLLRAAAVAPGARPHEPARHRHRLGLPDARHHRGRRVGGAGPRRLSAPAIRGCRRCRCRIPRSSSRSSAGPSIPSSCSRRGGSAGAGDGRRIFRRSASAIVLLELRADQLFPDAEPQLLNLLLVGISHRTAPVELRERVDFQARGVTDAAARPGWPRVHARGGDRLDVQPRGGVRGAATRPRPRAPTSNDSSPSSTTWPRATSRPISTSSTISRRPAICFEWRPVSTRWSSASRRFSVR